MSYALTIAGVPRTMQPGWNIDATANGRDVFTFRVQSLDGSYRPALDQEVILTENGVRIFGGTITRPSEAGLAALGVTPIETTITAIDFNALADRRYITATISAGTLKAALTVVVPYLPGATLDPAQVDGPALPELVYADVKVVDVLNDFTIQSGGYLWEIDANVVARMFAPGTVNAPFNITVPSSKAIGDVTVEPTRLNYGNRIIVRTATLRSMAEDAGEQAAHGLWEVLYTAPDTTTQPALDALAAMILARSLATLKTVGYHTRTTGLRPGMAQGIVLPIRNLNNTFLITAVKTHDIGPLLIGYDVTAIEGLVYQAGWRETWRKMVAGGGQTVGGGSGSGASVTRYAYPLATGVDAVQSPTPTWVPATGGSLTLGQGTIQVGLNTIPRGDLSALVSVRLRALDAGVSVQARLFDVTTGTPCAGLSSVVTSTTWTDAPPFTVTLAAGSHRYELELLPSVANADVQASGYVE